MIDTELLREWVRAEIYAIFEEKEPGEDGYYGNSNRDRKEADRIFAQVVTMFEDNESKGKTPWL